MFQAWNTYFQVLKYLIFKKVKKVILPKHCQKKYSRNKAMVILLKLQYFLAVFLMVHENVARPFN